MSFVNQATDTISLQMIPSSTTRVFPDFPALVHSFTDCIEDVDEWMSDSMLKTKNDKIELIAIGTKSKISQITHNLTPVSISGHDIPFSQSVRNLGVFVDETLSMYVHIKHL